MEQKHYFYMDGVQKGPYNLEQLLKQPINEDTLIWADGMADWTKLSQVPEVYKFINSRNKTTSNQFTEPSYSSYKEPITQTIPNKEESDIIYHKKTNTYKILFITTAIILLIVVLTKKDIIDISGIFNSNSTETYGDGGRSVMGNRTSGNNHVTNNTNNKIQKEFEEKCESDYDKYEAIKTKKNAVQTSGFVKEINPYYVALFTNQDNLQNWEGRLGEINLHSGIIITSGRKFKFTYLLVPKNIGEENKFNDILSTLQAGDIVRFSFKIVVFDEADYKSAPFQTMIWDSELGPALGGGDCTFMLLILELYSISLIDRK